LLFKHLWLATDRHLEAIDDAGIRFRPLAKYLVGLIVVPCVASALMLLLIGSIALWYSAFLWIAPSAYMVSILFKTYLERHHRRDYKTAAAQILSHVPHMVLASWGSILWVSAMRGGR
jgi:uncharacterized protein involved in cysteine biosynthesis